MATRFTLVYRGPLHSNGSARERQAIRETIHPQLRKFCQKSGVFQDALRDDLKRGELIRGEVDIPRPLEIPFYRWHIGDLQWTPIVSYVHDLMCELEIEWFRRETPGSIIGDGDLDNRLKTLLDGLRMPRSKPEQADASSEGDPFRLCLLDDDKRVRAFSVRTYELLEDERPDEKRSGVELFIHVTIVPLSPNTYMNIGV